MLPPAGRLMAMVVGTWSDSRFFQKETKETNNLDAKENKQQLEKTDRISEKCHMIIFLCQKFTGRLLSSNDGECYFGND